MVAGLELASNRAEMMAPPMDYATIPTPGRRTPSKTRNAPQVVELTGLAVTFVRLIPANVHTPDAAPLSCLPWARAEGTGLAAPPGRTLH